MTKKLLPILLCLFSLQGFGQLDSFPPITPPEFPSLPGLPPLLGPVPPPPGLLLINEVDYTQHGVDNKEFIELVSGPTIDLNQYYIVLYNGDPLTLDIYDTIFLPPIQLGAGEYFVICGDGSSVPNCDLEVTQLDDFIQNGSPDAIAIVHTTSNAAHYIDAISYGGNCPPPFIRGSGVPDTLADNDSDSLVGLSRIPDGVNLDDTGIGFRLRCITPGEPNGTDSIPCFTITSLGPLKAHDWQFSPNPVSNKINLLFKGLYFGQIKLYTQTGQLLQEQYIQNQSQVQMDVSSYAPGIYFLEMDNGNQRSVEKVIISR